MFKAMVKTASGTYTNMFESMGEAMRWLRSKAFEAIDFSITHDGKVCYGL